ncbi:MAG: hypothetical protein ACHQQQ_02480 [Bacteroidota bacterium]
MRNFILLQARDPFHLNMTNIALGCFVIALVAYLIVNIVIDLRQRKDKKKIKMDLKSILTKLGVTMQDGGEKSKKDDEEPEV